MPRHRVYRLPSFRPGLPPVIMSDSEEDDVEEHRDHPAFQPAGEQTNEARPGCKIRIRQIK